jgi:transcriptional regulator with XRE-family HTH domain
MDTMIGMLGAVIDDPPSDDLASRLRTYMAQHSLTVEAVVRRTGISRPPIDSLLKGRPIWEKSRLAIENFLATGGKSLVVQRPPGPALDETGEGLMTIVVGLAMEQNELDELLRTAFNRWCEGKSKVEAQQFVVNLLRGFLANMEPAGRLNMLLQVRDVLRAQTK